MKFRRIVVLEIHFGLKFHNSVMKFFTDGYRNYPKEIVKRIRFIKRAQALGFSLDEVAELLELDLADACVKSCDLAERKLVVIDQKMAELAAMRRALAKLMAECDKKSRRGACPIIAALQREPGQR